MTEGSQRLSSVVEQFLTYLQYRKNRSQATIVTYQSMLGFFIEYVDDCCIDDLSVKQVDDYAMSLTVSGLKPKSYRNRLVPIRSLFRYLYLKDLTDIRPEKIEIPSDPEQEANFLIPEEQEQLLAACETPREKALVMCLLKSGVRVSELVDARADDLYNRSLVIRKGKGGKARVTFIDTEADQAISEYHSSLRSKPLWLFTGVNGDKLSRQYVHRMIIVIAKRSGIEKHISPHTLRHTFATNLLMNGARAEDVQPMMGHKNIRTTLIYTHFTNDYLHGQYDKFTKPAVENALT